MHDEVMIDALAALVPGGGIGRYVRDLHAALTRLPDAPTARFAYPRNFRERARQALPPGRCYEIPLPWYALRAVYSAAALFERPVDALFDGPAVYHSPVGYGPTFRHARLLCHVHDLTTLEHPEWHPFRANQFLRATMPFAARRADTILTHSEHVAARAADCFGVPRTRIVTIPPPLGHGFHPVDRTVARERVTRRFGLEGGFVLHVGTIEPRKNHIGLVAAYERLRHAGFAGPLVLVGQPGWRYRPILRRIEQSEFARSILLVHDANDEDLVALYGACTLCAYPSFEEGFGMPLLESMACGAPCVTSDHPALVELGHDVAWTVPAHDVSALADAMISVWRGPDDCDTRIAAGRRRAEHYRFERWAERTFALYRRELARAAGREVIPPASTVEAR